MTNLEKIRQMTDEELANFLSTIVMSCYYCLVPNEICNSEKNCLSSYKAWLESEVKE